MRKSSLILLLAMAFVFASVASGFSAGTILDGPCKELCTDSKTGGWDYNLYIEEYSCNKYEQADWQCPCPLVDYESASSYCDDDRAAAGIVLKVCDCDNADQITLDKNYGIKIEIVEPATGVFFTNWNTNTFDCAEAVTCDDTSTDVGASIYVRAFGDPNGDEGAFCPEICTVPDGATAGTPYAFSYKPLDSGRLFTPEDQPGTNEECCLDCLNSKLSKAVITTCYAPIMAANSPYILIDMPTLVTDKELPRGTEIKVKVTLVAEPSDDEICTTCNDLCSCIVKIAEVGCPTTPEVGYCTFCFPYFTSVDEDWWSAFALTNSGSQSAVAEITFTAGGTSVPVSITVPAKSVVAKALSSLSLDALAGKGPIYAEVQSYYSIGEDKFPASVTGFAIMGDGAQAYGYLSKAGECGCDSCK